MFSVPFVLTAFLLLSVSTSWYGAWVAWQQRAKASARPMLVLCAAIGFWAACYCFELNSPSLNVKIFWSIIKYPAIAIIPVAVAIFLLRFAGWSHWPSRRLLAGLLLIPSLTVVVGLTNPFHHLFWVQWELQVFPTYTSLKTVNGIWFGVHAFYSYTLILISAIVAISGLARAWRPPRRQLIWLMLGLAFPFAVNLLAVLNIRPVPGIDLSPVAFGWSALMLLLSTGLTSILDVSPLAHTLLMSQMQDGVIVLDHENRIYEINPAAQQIVGQSRAGLVEKDIAVMLPTFATLTQEPPTITHQRDIQLGTVEAARWYDLRISTIRTSHGDAVGRLMVLHDITERKRAESELRYASAHDGLTGLYNRMYFNEEFARLAKGRQRPITIFLADIDSLKPVNDTWGHSAGDTLLIQTAEVLRSVFRKDDLVARIGGDEFAALLPGCDAQNAHTLRERLYTTLTRHNAARPAHDLSFSLGYAVAENGDDLAQTMHNADQNLYAEKARRKQERLASGARSS